ncbi:circumsporozoite protein-like [Penaeus vannamei]|uniref:circumsporozoite protein-like n=1 Tax=Penaeus vannamei TaxID=6689 RepID=UPI00387F7AA4
MEVPAAQFRCVSKPLWEGPYGFTVYPPDVTREASCPSRNPPVQREEMDASDNGSVAGNKGGVSMDNGRPPLGCCRESRSGGGGGGGVDGDDDDGGGGGDGDGGGDEDGDTAADGGGGDGDESR